MSNESSWDDFREADPNLYLPHQQIDYAGNGNPMQSLYLSVPRSITAPVPVLIFFHGGGLLEDCRHFPGFFLSEGKYLTVECRYRIMPDASPDECLQDCAAAIAWVFKHIKQYGGDVKNIFVGGLSAGAWLAAMAGMAPDLLAPFGISNRDIAGLLLFSGQMTAHFRVKTQLAYPGLNQTPVVDRYAPMHYVSADLPPILMITGESGLELPARPEENAYMAAVLKACGHQDAVHHIMGGYGHFDSMNAGQYLAAAWVNQHIRQ